MENNNLLKSIFFFVLLITTLSSNENWIKIDPINKSKAKKSQLKLDANLSDIEPINKMMKRASVIKQIIDASSEKEKPLNTDKNWFTINHETTR